MHAYIQNINTGIKRLDVVINNWTALTMRTLQSTLNYDLTFR